MTGVSERSDFSHHPTNVKPSFAAGEGSVTGVSAIVKELGFSDSSLS